MEIDGVATADTPEATQGRHDAIAAVAKYPYRDLAVASLARLVAPAAAQDIRDQVVDMSVRVGPEAYVRQQRAITARPDSRPLLSHIVVPTLVLVGEEDVLTPPALAEEMAAAIPHATLVCVPGSGHLAPLEAPAPVTAALRAWLTE